jgi:aspartate 1-decarboxylase
MPLRRMLKSKIHRATVTEANLAYEGSITIDATLMQQADILPYEEIHVLDVNNGARLTTYVIEGPADSGVICINGAAAHLVHEGDLVILLTYTEVMDETEARRWEPRLVFVDEQNRIKRIGYAPLATAGATR